MRNPARLSPDSIEAAPGFGGERPQQNVHCGEQRKNRPSKAARQEQQRGALLQQAKDFAQAAQRPASSALQVGSVPSVAMSDLAGALARRSIACRLAAGRIAQ